MVHSESTLLIISPGFPATEKDSTCLPAQQLLIRCLQEEYPGLRIVVLALEYPFSALSYTWHGIEVFPFDGDGRRKLGKLILFLQVWRRLRKLARKHHIIGVLSFWVGECALLGKRFAKRHGVPHLTWILGQDARKGNPYVPFIRPAASELVAMSGSLAQEFYHNYGILPDHLIPNGVEEPDHQSADTSRQIDLLGVGSLIPLKQYDLFLDVVSNLKREIPGIRALICGKGPLKETLRKKIIARGLGENLQLAGEISHEETLLIMRQAKILLHPSSYEGFSTVCLEALAAGAHVISFCNPMVGWIKHWNIVGSTEEMVSAAREILLNHSTEFNPVIPFRMKDSARQIMRLFGYK